MDPLSQAVVGGVVAAGLSRGDQVRRAAAVGALAAMSADLDVLIGSDTDHLLGLMFHRHFTHALLFIPLGAWICSLILAWPFQQSWQSLYRWCFLGYATAAPLDACTSYGTHLLWPFTDERMAWNLIAIVDPVYTLTLLALLIAACWKNSCRLLTYAMVLMVSYHLLGWVQRERAEDVLKKWAIDRGHHVERIWAQPSLGNLVIWRGLIETKDLIKVFGIRTGVETGLVEAGAYKVYDPDTDVQLKKKSILHNDIDRFTLFSSGYVARVKVGNEDILTDARYSPNPWTLDPLWGLELNFDSPNKHARMRYFRDPRALRLRSLWDAICGNGVFSNSASRAVD